ncbi:thiol reductant ABC exporter subunit CydC, partial [Actinoplanes sp. NPDC051633]|uniref:thiol reductant ABC exporter subunit CydC n=1 Tax=Actinoplanes sp. NPDC051633 TaxID=3155670 RepID=UPI003420CB0E
GILLTGAAVWLLVRAAELPPVLTLSAAVVLVRGSAVARPLLRYAERLVAHQVAFGRLGVRRAAVYAGLVPRVPGPRVRRRGELLTRVVDDVDADVDGLLRGVLPAVAALLAAAVAVAVVAAVRPVAAVPLIAGIVVAGGVAPALGVWLEARREAVTGQARAEMRDAVVETVDGLEEVRSLGVPVERSRRLARTEALAARGAGLATAIGHLGWGLAVAGAAVLLAPAVGLDREWAAVLLLGIVALAEPMAVLPDAALAHRRAVAARRRLATLTGDPLPARPRHDQPAGARPVDGSVRIRGLAAGWDRAAFQGLRLDVPAGGATVVLGPSGSGKSTLAAVLAGFLDPRAGSVRIGGVDLATLDEATLRGTVALVGDETEHVFASTVRENLRIARPGATDAELEAVLRRVGLDGWGKTLDTRLGSGGSTLSGGQRKRLATARALLADPLLLILDEPTEGLDEAGAEVLMSDLLRAAREKAVLVLTHRTDGLQPVPRRRVHMIGDLVVPVADGERAGGLEHQDGRAGRGDRLVLGAPRYDEDAAARQGHAAVAQLD